MEGLTGVELRRAVEEAMSKYFLDIANSRANQPNDLTIVNLDLSNAGGSSLDPSLMDSLYPNGYPINFPYRSIYVASASDAEAYVNFIPNTSQGNIGLGSLQQSFPLSLKDSVKKQTASAQGLITWPSQPGKNITLVFSINSEITSGSQVQLVSGGVTLSNGSSVDEAVFGALGTSARLPVTAAPMIIIPANSLRKVARFQVSGGDIRIGTGSVVVTPGSETGMLLSDGDYYEWRNTGVLFAAAASGSPIITGTQET